MVKGPSGSGKTTLLMSIGGMLQPTGGKVEVLGKPIYSLQESEKTAFRGRNIGFIFQMFHLIPYFTVAENIMVNNSTGNHLFNSSQLEEIAGSLGISHRLGHYPSELSAGEKQRVALARALIKKPELILADEPTGNLDEENSHVVLQQLKQYAQQGGTVILVSHDEHPTQYATKVITIGQHTENQK